MGSPSGLSLPQTTATIAEIAPWRGFQQLNFGSLASSVGYLNLFCKGLSKTCQTNPVQILPGFPQPGVKGDWSTACSGVRVPSVTAVVPLYNKAPYIERCLRSIQAQSFADFEAVVVDDGSTDHSADVASQAVRNDPRFRIVVQQNRGEGAARNRGIQEARTGLIAFLGADDEWEPSFLEAITDLARQFPGAGILATGFLGRSADAPDQEITLAGAGCKLIHDYFHRAKFVDIIWPSASAVPLNVLKAVGGFAEGVPLG